MRRNADAVGNSDTANALETFFSDDVSRLAKVPETVSKQASEMAK